METLKKMTVGDYVAQDFRTAALFSKYGIDFCCKGNRLLADVCDAKFLNVDIIENELAAIINMKDSDGIDFKAFSPNLLIDYIVEQHHQYVEEKTKPLLFYLEKLCKVHGTAHPELFEINHLFKDGAGALAQHMKKEELLLFPFIKKLASAAKNKQKVESPHFGSVENPIAAMKDDHEEEGERFAKIATLTNNYTPPADACETYKVTYAMLKDFEQDLHKHIHLENNILFLKAKQLQEECA